MIILIKKYYEFCDMISLILIEDIEVSRQKISQKKYKLGGRVNVLTFVECF
jgi:hypothetical protein